MRSWLYKYGLAAVIFMVGCGVWAEDAVLPPDTSFNPTAGRGDIVWINLRTDSALDYSFGLDTGATMTVLDKSWDPRLEARPRQTVVGARWAVSGVFTSPALLLGGVPLRMGQMVVTEDLAAHYPSHPVAGILGMDCLGHYCLQFDFSENKLRFLDASRLAGQDLGKSYPIEPILGCFFVNDNVAGVKGIKSLIDTGCNFDGVLIPDLFRQWENPQQGAETAASGGAHYPDGVFAGVVYNNLYLASDGEQTLIGLHFLARNLVTLNFPGRTLYLQQRSAAPLPGDGGYFDDFYKKSKPAH